MTFSGEKMPRKVYWSSRIYQIFTWWTFETSRETRSKVEENVLGCCPLRYRLRSAFAISSTKISNSASWIVSRTTRTRFSNSMCTRIIIRTMWCLKTIGKSINLRNNRYPAINITRISITFTSWVKWYRLTRKLLSRRTVGTNVLTNIIHYRVICFSLYNPGEDEKVTKSMYIFLTQWSRNLQETITIEGNNKLSEAKLILRGANKQHIFYIEQTLFSKYNSHIYLSNVLLFWILALSMKENYSDH